MVSISALAFFRNSARCPHCSVIVLQISLDLKQTAGYFRRGTFLSNIKDKSLGNGRLAAGSLTPARGSPVHTHARVAQSDCRDSSRSITCWNSVVSHLGQMQKLGKTVAAADEAVVEAADRKDTSTLEFSNLCVRCWTSSASEPGFPAASGNAGAAHCRDAAPVVQFASIVQFAAQAGAAGPLLKALGIYSHLLMCTESRRQQGRLKGFSSWRQSRGI